MKIRFLFSLAVLAVMACSRQELTPEPQATASDPVLHPSETQAPAKAIIRVTRELADQIEAAEPAGSIRTKSASLNTVFESLNITSLERVFPDGGAYEPRAREAGLHLFYEVEIDPAVPQTKALSAISEVSGIEEVEFDRPIKLRAFNDPYLAQQWHYYNPGTKSGYKAGADINVKQVWEEFGTGNAAVIVNVVDAGVLLTHPDLAANAIPAGENGSKNFTNNTYVIGAGSHGTHVAGTIAAVNNNGLGVCGIAGGDYAAGIGGARILSSQIFGATDSDPDASTSQTANAIRWGADHGAVICQNSWGYYADSNDDGTVSDAEYQAFRRMTIPSSIKAAIDYFIRYAGCDNAGNQLPDSPMKGGVVFFAAGNENIDYDPICAYEPVIAVGAFGPTGEKAYYSNYGPWVDLAAPGGDYYAPSRNNSNQVYSLSLNNSYAWYQGTSMACPHASGVAALLVSTMGGAGFTNEMLKEALLKAANTEFFEDNTIIGPKIDAYASAKFFSSEPPQAATRFEAEAASNRITATVGVTESKDGERARGARIFATRRRADLNGLNPASPLATVQYVDVLFEDNVSVGDDVSATLEDLEFEADYYVAAVMFNRYRQYSELSPVVQVRTGINQPPVIETDYTGGYTFREFQSVTVPFRIYDPEEHALTVTLETNGKATLSANPAAGIWTFVLNCPAQGAGSWKAVIKATDAYGKTSQQDVSYTILPNNPPVATNPIRSLVMAPGESKTFDLSTVFTDEDGETLEYLLINSSTSVVKAEVSGGVLKLDAQNYGQSDIVLTARDALSNTASSFSVLVREGGREIDFYPNPVIDRLNVRPGVEERDTRVRVVSQTGVVFADVTQLASAFQPVAIDMKKAAPGSYRVLVDYGTDSYSQTVVKK